LLNAALAIAILHYTCKIDSKQYFFISRMISPTDLFHPPQAPHFKTFQMFLIYCPKYMPTKRNSFSAGVGSHWNGSNTRIL